MGLPIGSCPKMLVVEVLAAGPFGAEMSSAGFFSSPLTAVEGTAESAAESACVARFQCSLKFFLDVNVPRGGLHYGDRV